MGDESANLRKDDEQPAPASPPPPSPMPGEAVPVVGSSHIFHEAPFFAAKPQPATESMSGVLTEVPHPVDRPSVNWAEEAAAIESVAAPAAATPVAIQPEAIAADGAKSAELPSDVAGDAKSSDPLFGPDASAIQSPPASETAASVESSVPVPAASGEATPATTEGEAAGEDAPAWSSFNFNPDAASSEDASPEEEEEEEGEPEELPPPSARGVRIPIVASELSLAMAVFAGVGMVAAQRMLYLPLLYSIAFGMLLGWTLARAPQRGCTNRALLLALTVVTVLLTQCVFYLGNFLWDNHQSQVKRFAIAEFADLLTVDDAQRVGRYLQAEAARKRVFGFPLGETGSYVLASLELVLMFTFAWMPVRSAVRLKLAGSVPVEVLERVMELRRRKLEQPEVFLKLSEQGWINPSDQRQAWDAASAYMELVSRRRRR